MMKTNAAKSQQPASPSDLLADYAQHMRALEVKDRGLLSEQIQLENSGATPQAPVLDAEHEAATLARSFLNGHAGPLPAASADHRLRQVRTERRAIEIALGDLQQQDSRARAVVVREAIAARESEWHAIQRRRFAAIQDLRAANKAAADMRDEISAISGWPTGLRGDRVTGIFAAKPIVDDPVYRFIESLVAEGFVFRKEAGQ